MRKILIAFIILFVFVISPVVANVPIATLMVDGQPVDLGNLAVTQQGSGDNVQQIYELGQPIETDDYTITNIIVNTTENPSVSYAIGIIDTGTPSAFTFSYNSSISPVIAGPNKVHSSMSFSTTDGGSDGVSVTALAPSAGIPVDSDGITEMQVTTVSNGTVRNNIGLDLGGPGITFPPGTNSATWGPFSEGFISGPESATGWINIQIDINFQGSGGGDIYTLSGLSDINVTAAAIGRSDTGVFRSGQWILDYGIDGVVDRRFQYGLATDKPVSGDFNNDGQPDIGVFRSGQWILDYGMDRVVDRRFQYGLATDIPFVGDFNNDGITDIGVFRTGQWILDYGINGVVDRRFQYGLATDIPFVGDFNNDGITDIGVFRTGQWILDYGINGVVDRRFQYGLGTDIPVVGEFNNDGITDIGVFRTGQWILDYGINGVVDRRFQYGLGTDVPIVGKWI